MEGNDKEKQKLLIGEPDEWWVNRLLPSQNFVFLPSFSKSIAFSGVFKKDLSPPGPKIWRNVKGKTG